MTTPEERSKRALEIRNNLAHFTGTEQYYRHALMRPVLYTDGVKYLADTAESHWLVDKIASLQLEPKIGKEPFQVWRLAVSDGSALLTCTDGGKSTNNGVADILHSEHIPFTDFPLDEIDLWVEKDGSHAVILLPDEH
jgi:hypothetical protein